MGANLRDAWIPLDGVKSGELQVSADFTPYDDMDDMSSRKSSKSGGNLIPEKERDGMRNRGGSPGNDDTFGSGPNQRKPSDKQAPGLGLERGPLHLTRGELPGLAGGERGGLLAL